MELTYHDIINSYIYKTRSSSSVNNVFKHSFFILVLCPGKVQVFHAVVLGSNPGDDHFILLSQSFFSKFYFFIVMVRVRVRVSFGVDLQ